MKTTHICYFALACGGVFTGLSGNITSPGYPSIYPNNARCRYEIRMEGDTKIRLQIHFFDLENGYDKLRIQQTVSGSDNVVADLSGTIRTPRNYTSAENRFILLFTSDHSITKRGFIASYHAIRPGKWFKTFMQ